MLYKHARARALTSIVAVLGFIYDNVVLDTYLALTNHLPCNQLLTLLQRVKQIVSVTSAMCHSTDSLMKLDGSHCAYYSTRPVDKCIK